MGEQLSFEGSRGSFVDRLRGASCSDRARMAKLADAQDLKSCGGFPPCGFDSHSGHPCRCDGDRAGSTGSSKSLSLSPSVGELLTVSGLPNGQGLGPDFFPLGVFHSSPRSSYL